MDLELKLFALLVLLSVTECFVASDKNAKVGEPQQESNRLLSDNLRSGHKQLSDSEHAGGERMEEAVEPQKLNSHRWSELRREYTTGTTSITPSPKLLEKKRIGNHKNSKEIRRKLRKLWKELQLLMSGTIQRRECKRFADCKIDECCLWKGKKRYCRKRPKLGHRCRPSLLPGLGGECPCPVGATCTSVNIGKGMKLLKHKCRLLIKNEPTEMEQSFHRRNKRLQRDITNAFWQTKHSSG